MFREEEALFDSTEQAEPSGSPEVYFDSEDQRREPTKIRVLDPEALEDGASE